jgi:hypothetical protein
MISTPEKGGQRLLGSVLTPAPQLPSQWGRHLASGHPRRPCVMLTRSPITHSGALTVDLCGPRLRGGAATKVTVATPSVALFVAKSCHAGSRGLDGTTETAL